MDAVLEQLGQIPGVVGAMVYDVGGAPQATRFPEIFDRSTLDAVAATLAQDTHLEGWLKGPGACLDFRYAEGRVVLRPLPGAWLLVLCTAQVNAQLLSLSLTQALRRLSGAAARPSRPLPAAPVAPPPALAPPPPSAVEGLRATLVDLVKAELGAYSNQAVELLQRAATVGALAEASSEVEQLTRLFVSKRKAEELAAKVKVVFQKGAPK